MQPDPLLSQAELDFIQDLQQGQQMELNVPSPGLRVQGQQVTRELLTHLIGQEQVTLHATVDNQQISFPLQLVEDEFHTVHLHLGSPEIYEDGPMLRAWRLSLEHPSLLRDPLGKPSTLWVRDLSFNGMLVEVHGQHPAPAQFDLDFAPAGIAAITLHGELRRRIGPALAAYDLSSSDRDEIDRLRDYVLQAHRRAHPELHTQVSS
ncbi:hypothetical protein [Pseudomonas sp.]|uniref:hypothetical protein n=1 Tax=Pseudomonas sp. TaxID=306 RepID=UPI0028B162C1|nr:hypothetical protein [Pseudomonas sp.]